MKMIEVGNLWAPMLSIVISLTTLSLYVNSSTECVNFFELPLIALGVFMAFVSLLGLIASYCRSLWIYLSVILVLLLGLIAFTVFAVALKNMEVGEVISGKQQKGYYTNRLQKYVVDGDNWVMIKSCLVEIDVCESFPNEGHPDLNFSPTQSGCCQPPTECGVIDKNATFWLKPESDPNVTNSDCITWSSNQAKLCYDCKSCKAGFLATLKKDWRERAIINAALIVCLLIIYSIGCFDLMKNLIHAYRKRNKVFPVMDDL